MARPGVHRVPDGFDTEWPGASASATEVVLNLIRAGEELNARVDAFVRRYGLPSSTALIVLEVLRGEGTALTPSTIAARSFVSRSALTGVMHTLQRRGLLTRSAHPGDLRRTAVEITPAGTRLLEQLLPELHRAEVEWTKTLSPRQQADLLHLLGKLPSTAPT